MKRYGLSSERLEEMEWKVWHDEERKRRWAKAAVEERWEEKGDKRWSSSATRERPDEARRRRKGDLTFAFSCNQRAAPSRAAPINSVATKRCDLHQHTREIEPANAAPSTLFLFAKKGDVPRIFFVVPLKSVDPWPPLMLFRSGTPAAAGLGQKFTVTRRIWFRRATV